MSNDVYIVGIDMIRFGRFEDAKPESLAAQAALMALDDCGQSINDTASHLRRNLQWHDDGPTHAALYRSDGRSGRQCHQRPARPERLHFARHGLPSRLAFMTSVSPLARKRWARACSYLRTVAAPLFPQKGCWDLGSCHPYSPKMGMEHTRKYGTTFEQFARVSEKNHHHSTLNPKALYQKETPLDVVMAADMIAYPLTKLMCSVNVDGSAAAVLMSEKKTKELGLMDRAVRVRASALASDPFSERNLVMQDVNTVTQLAAKSAYDMAGLGPEDVDLVELHDCFATAEICHYENLDLCGEGEGGAFLDSGATSLGGKIPVNVSGGLLSKGHPLGATGIANIYEISSHLRGEAGARQVEGARIGMTHVVGLGSACAVHLFEKA